MATFNISRNYSEPDHEGQNKPHPTEVGEHALFDGPGSDETSMPPLSYLIYECEDKRDGYWVAVRDGSLTSYSIDWRMTGRYGNAKKIGTVVSRVLRLHS